MTTTIDKNTSFFVNLHNTDVLGSNDAQSVDSFLNEIDNKGVNRDKMISLPSAPSSQLKLLTPLPQQPQQYYRPFYGYENSPVYYMRKPLGTYSADCALKTDLNTACECACGSKCGSECRCECGSTCKCKSENKEAATDKCRCVDCATASQCNQYFVTI